MIILTDRQKLVLFLMDCDPGVKEWYWIHRLYDRADFPFDFKAHIDPLLENGLIYIAEKFFNGQPKSYAVTEQGKKTLEQQFDAEAIIALIKSMDSPDLLLEITTIYIERAKA